MRVNLRVNVFVDRLSDSLRRTEAGEILRKVADDIHVHGFPSLGASEPRLVYVEGEPDPVASVDIWVFDDSAEILNPDARTQGAFEKFDA